MTATTKTPIMIYTEATPNPETLKFVANKLVVANDSLDFPTRESAAPSPLAESLFDFPFVQGVFLANNFVTITKTAGTDWHEIIPSLREYLKEYLSENRDIVSEAYLQERLAARQQSVSGDADDIDTRIKQLLDKYVRPAVEMDGGAIIFKSFENGVVKLQMQGSCSGCPSSTVTLKAGIEGLLKRMLPEVQSVEAEEV
jgi:Fe-S cluster biogenesis protein NfuA